MESLAFDSFFTTVLAGAVFLYVLYRQWVARPLTRMDFLLPLVGAMYLGIRYLGDSTAPVGLIIQASAVIGIASGLVAGHLVQVWKDERTGLAYQYGGTRYALVVAALLLGRVGWDLFTNGVGISASVGTLNDAFLALTLGNYFGRNLHVGGRALHLIGWNPRAIPTRRQVKEIRARTRDVSRRA
jgi:hypothetical protein